MQRSRVIMDDMTSPDTTITLFSPTQSPGQIRERLLTLSGEDGITFLGTPFADDRDVTLNVPAELLNDALGWLDDVALAEGFGIRLGDEILRFGDEDVSFTMRLHGDDDTRLGATRIGLEPILRSLEDADHLTVARFDLDDPADESAYLKAQRLPGLEGWTLHNGVAGTASSTILPDVDATVTAMLRWMNGEDVSDLDWVRS